MYSCIDIDDTQYTLHCTMFYTLFTFMTCDIYIYISRT